MPANASPSQQQFVPRKSRWHVGFWLALLIVCAFGLLIRYPSISVLCFNPDEADYQASAAYFWQEGQSPFSNPPAYFPYVVGYHQILANCFGPYCVPELRWVIAVVSVIIAICVFLQMTPESGPFMACCCAMLFLGMNTHQEGLSANREWPCLLFVQLAAVLFLIQERRTGFVKRPAICFTACLVSSLSVMGKEQGLVLTMAIPLYIILKSLGERQLRSAVAPLLACLGGGILAGLIYVAPLAWHGTLNEHVSNKLDFGASYTQGRTNDWLHRLSVELSGFSASPLWKCIVICACLSSVIILRTLLRKKTPTSALSILDTPLARLNAIQFLLSLYAIQMGLRFFSHYFLLMIPAMAILLGILALAVERWLLAWIPRAYLGKRAMTQMIFRLGVAAVFLSPDPAVYSGIGFPQAWVQREVANLNLKQVMSPRDRIFVWGWFPEIYIALPWIPATRFAGCATIVYDFGRPIDAPPVALVANKTKQLLAELEHSQPEILIDAGQFSYAMNGNSIYELHRYPEIQNYVNQHFRFLVQSPVGIKVYQRIRHPTNDLQTP